MGSILVLYHSTRAPLRRAISDHLYSFRRYSGRPCTYINVAVRSVPSWIGKVDIDLVVLHTTLLAERWQRLDFLDVARRMRAIRKVRAPKVALPQDEFLNTDPLMEMLHEMGVDHVFTCAAQEDWATIYGPLVTKGVGFTRVLPGYLEPHTVRRIERLSHQVATRDIDIGYRAWQPEPWLGQHGMLKGWVADAVAAEARNRGLRHDISLDERDTLLGDAWYLFLLRSRYTIGVEGGASVLDRDGRIRACADGYVSEHPDAPFEEVERACFPGLDGKLNLRTISPRHLEACATRTPQILVEGTYNGVLQAGRHYVPLRRDFSNLSEVVDQVARGVDHREMAEQAYADIVASGRHSYEAFLRTVLEAVPLPTTPLRRRQSMLVRGLSAWEHAIDAPSWGLVRVRQSFRLLAREILRRTGLLPSVMRGRAARRERRLREG